MIISNGFQQNNKLYPKAIFANNLFDHYFYLFFVFMSILCCNVLIEYIQLYMVYQSKYFRDFKTEHRATFCSTGNDKKQILYYSLSKSWTHFQKVDFVHY